MMTQKVLMSALQGLCHQLKVIHPLHEALPGDALVNACVLLPDKLNQFTQSVQLVN